MSVFMNIFRLAFILLTCLSFPRPGLGLEAPAIEGALNQTTNAGYFTLDWQDYKSAVGAIVSVEQSETEDFSGPTQVFPTGIGSSLFFSGLEDGTYYFRVKVQDYHANQAAYSDTLKLEVAHFSSTQAMLLFVLGALTFAGIVTVILRGER